MKHSQRIQLPEPIIGRLRGLARATPHKVPALAAEAVSLGLAALEQRYLGGLPHGLPPIMDDVDAARADFGRRFEAAAHFSPPPHNTRRPASQADSGALRGGGTLSPSPRRKHQPPAAIVGTDRNGGGELSPSRTAKAALRKAGR